MHKIVTLSLVVAAVVGTGSVAYAQADRTAPVTRAPLTRTAVEQRSAEAFARMDANDDGKLDQADRAARRQAGQQQRFARLDANSDGELNQADRAARRQQAFDRVDADDSGGISLAEFAALREQRGEMRAERRGPGGPRLGRRGRGGPGAGFGPRGARAADADNDGAVSQAEFASAALARFDRLDANKDGTVGADERRQPRRMRGQRRAPNAG